MKNMLKLLHLPYKLFLLLLRRISPVRYARLLGVKCGEGCSFIRPMFGTEPYLINIGNNVQITHGVTFLTHDGSLWWLFKDKYPDIDYFAEIQIGNNVFVGVNSIIMPGVTIGNNCIIGAGSIVTKDVPDNSVVAGVPARFIKSVDDYFHSKESQAIHIRRLSSRKKKEVLSRRYS